MIGRFAPSPTGSLHFGSLIAATASYLSIKSKTGDKQWQLRIEDVDTGRIQKGATKSIIHTLESYGFEWDGDIIYQSQRAELYKAALESIKDYIYPCSCTRKSLMNSENYAYIYPGLCRKGMTNPESQNHSIRVLTHDDLICFTDFCQEQNQEHEYIQEAHPPTFTHASIDTNIDTNQFCQNINQAVGDFILKRSDGLWAYQLAVVVDDARQGITEVVRGADLFDNTPRQVYLQGLLGYPTPDYLHFPVAVDKNGKKLSKQNQAPEISLDKRRKMLINALRFLGQKPPKANEFASLDDLWSWAMVNWNEGLIPKKMTKSFSPK